MKKETIDILNFRITEEEKSSRLYEQMYLWLENQGMLNTAKLFKKYSIEELIHADWAKKYLLDFDIMPELSTIDEPINVFGSFSDIINKSFEHEQLILKQCNDLAIFATENKDYSLLGLAMKYCNEQVEELGKISQLKSIDKLSKDLLIIDHYIGDLK